MILRKRIPSILVTLAIAFAINVGTPEPADAVIHQIIAALCNGRGEVQPRGQLNPGPAQVRALLATGVIAEVIMTPTVFTVIMDPTVPNSKFIGVGFDVFVPDGIAPGIDLIISPFLIPDPEFPAHAHCKI